MFILATVCFLALLGILGIMQRQYISFNIRVLTALVLGLAFGLLIQFFMPFEQIGTFIYGVGSIGAIYIKLLRMIVVPLIFISVAAAFMKMQGQKELGKTVILIMGTLLGTTAIAATVGIIAASLAGLNAIHMDLIQNTAEYARATTLQQLAEGSTATFFIDKIVEIIPTNIIAEMAETRSVSILSVVFFTMFFGMASIAVAKKYPEEGAFINNLINALHKIIMRIVTMVLRLTPYGVLALMTKLTATNGLSDIIRLGNFVIASYAAILTMFIIHMIIVALQGHDPITYLRKALPALSLAFSSRSSSATMPLTTSVQSDLMGVDKGVASMAASFGSVMGQNGCAGIYPAMLAVMIAPAVGIPMGIPFYVLLILVCALGSFGIAGVGGGATFAAILVLSVMGLPIELVGLLIAIEPLIDMGRTALNVSGAMVAGVTTATFTGKMNRAIFKNKSLKSIELA